MFTQTSQQYSSRPPVIRSKPNFQRPSVVQQRSAHDVNSDDLSTELNYDDSFGKNTFNFSEIFPDEFQKNGSANKNSQTFCVQDNLTG